MTPPDAYLPVTIRDVPTECFFDAAGKMHAHVASYCRQGVIKQISVGPMWSTVVIDIKRPYWRPVFITESAA